MGCFGCKPVVESDYWIDKDNNYHWMIGDIDTGIDARGISGDTPFIGVNGNWWIGKTDTGVPANGVVIENGPQSASELF